MRVFTGGLATETNTFAPMPTGLGSFRDRGYYAAGKHPDAMSFFAAPLWAARQRAKERGWELVEGMVAAAQPSGTTTRFAYETLRDELLGDLRAAMPVDMVVLGLHGAMVAHGYDDCEGDLLARVREIVGPEVVVGAELDPHNHLTPAMLDNADLLIAFKEYPHTDVLERAWELVDLCAAMVEGRIEPVAAAVDCEMLVTMHTSRQPARGFVDRIQALEGHDGILSISVSHGFAWGDTEHMGTQILVYADGDEGKAKALARRLADELIGMREQLRVHFPSIDEALDRPWRSTAARSCWPTAPTTPGAALRATRPSCCAGCSSAASATPPSARCGIRWPPASLSRPAPARRCRCASAARSGRFPAIRSMRSAPSRPCSPR